MVALVVKSVHHRHVRPARFIVEHASSMNTARLLTDANLHPALKLSWLVCHGLAAVKLIQHFLRTFPSCASIGSSGENLSWAQRMAAAIGVVKGIQFLYTGIVPGLYSNNLKITDILLDNNLNVKICSYNIHLLAENKIMVTRNKSSLLLYAKSCLIS